MGLKFRDILRPHLALPDAVKKYDPVTAAIAKTATRMEAKYLDPTFDPNSPALREPPGPDYFKLYRKGELPGQRAMKSGGKVKKYSKGGVVRGDGCASKGKTKGRMR